MRIIISTLACLLIQSSLASAQVANIYLLEYVDPVTKKVTRLTQVPVQKESPAGLVIEPRRGEKKTVAALDIKNARYKPEGMNYIDFSKPFTAADRGKLETDPKKRATLFNEAIKGFATVVDKIRNEKPVFRYLQYRKAEALFEWSKDDPAKRDEAVAALTEFQKNHPDGWEITSALQMLAQLQQSAGNEEAEMKTYQAMAEIEGLPKELRWDALFSASRLLMRTNKLSAARTALQKLNAELPRDGTEQHRVQLYLAQCAIAEGGSAATKAVTDVEKLLSRTSDKSLKALGHNTLGEYYQKVKKDDLAFWEYFRVHVLYPENKREHAKALYHLATLFRSVKRDALRADECTELLKSSDYAGTIYHKQIATKK